MFISWMLNGRRELYINYALSDSVNFIFIALGMILEMLGKGISIENRGWDGIIRRILLLLLLLIFSRKGYREQVRKRLWSLLFGV